MKNITNIYIHNFYEYIRTIPQVTFNTSTSADGWKYHKKKRRKD